MARSSVALRCLSLLMCAKVQTWLDRLDSCLTATTFREYKNTNAHCMGVATNQTRLMPICRGTFTSLHSFHHIWLHFMCFYAVAKLLKSRWWNSPPFPFPLLSSLPLEVCPLDPARRSGGARCWEESKPKSNLVHFTFMIWPLVATMLTISLKVNWLKIQCGPSIRRSHLQQVVIFNSAILETNWTLDLSHYDKRIRLLWWRNGTNCKIHNKSKWWEFESTTWIPSGIWSRLYGWIGQTSLEKGESLGLGHILVAPLACCEARVNQSGCRVSVCVWKFFFRPTPISKLVWPISMKFGMIGGLRG